MNLGISALTGILMLVIPGYLFLLGQYYRTDDRPNFGFNRELLISVLVSTISHIIILITIDNIRFFPSVDFKEVYNIFVSTKYIPGEQFEASIPWFLAYMIAINTGCFLFGLTMAALKVRLVSPFVGIDKYLSPGVRGVWCVVDILTKDELKYRGFFHSFTRENRYCPSPTLNLFFASKRHNAIKEPPDESEYVSINSYVDYDEIAEMITPLIDNPEEAQHFIKSLINNDYELHSFLAYFLNASPNLQIIVSEIKNINIRPIELDIVTSNTVDTKMDGPGDPEQP